MIAIPVTLADLKDFTWGDFGKPITHDQFLTLVNEPPVQKITLNDTIPPFNVFGKLQSSDGLSASVQIAVNLNVNLFPQYAVEVRSDHGFEHLLLCKAIVKGTDGHNHLESVTLDLDDPLLTFNDAGLPNNTNPDYKSLTLDFMHKLAAGGKWQFSISIMEKNSDQYSNPVMQDVEGNNPIRLDFMNGKVDEQTGSTPLNVTQVLPLS